MLLKAMYWVVTLLFCLSLGMAFEQRAYAYTDPGSALLIFQSLGAVASGALFYFRRSLRRLFTRQGRKPASAASRRVDV